jgi:predicted dehydrogenase
MTKLRFAAIGINHAHIYGQVDCLLNAGAEFVGFHAPEDDLAKAFAARYPQAPRVADRRRLLEDATIPLIVSAGIPFDRAPLGVEVMRHGKDYMSDKPGMTSLEQLAEVRRVQTETKRIYSICYSEHFETRSTVKAGELIAAGAIGKVVSTTGIGPHKLKNLPRPDWFFRREKTGGVLTDIGSHQCEQFLFFAGALDAKVVAATVANRANPETPELQDFGEMLLRAGEVTGYVRVDWFAPDGLPVWGDGRLMILGTEGGISGTAKIYRHRWHTRNRSSLSGRSQGRAAHRLQRDGTTLWPPVDRGRFEPYRNRHAAGEMLQRDATRPHRPGHG